MSNAITEIDNTDLVFIFGYNPADSHPIVANHVINAKRNGAKIIVCDPRKIETARIADMHIALKNGSNIALLNAIGHVIIEEDLYDKSFVASRSEGFEEYRKIVEGYTPESVEEITGVSAREIRACARMYASAKSAAILWGMGVTQFYQGVETVRSLTSLAMLTGNLGKPHAGVNPVRGQNNVQGACDMGALPDTYPGYQYVKDPANREKFAKAWGVESLPAHTGYRISELPHRAAHGEVRAAYIMGEDPLQTDAELSAVRKAFEDLELVIVQDIFMTKTASAADVILPSTSWGEHEGVYTAADRGFQRRVAVFAGLDQQRHFGGLLDGAIPAIDRAAGRQDIDAGRQPGVYQRARKGVGAGRIGHIGEDEKGRGHRADFISVPTPAG